jgi:hypothetical protein
MRAMTESGWHPFQRITNAELELVEGTVLYVKAEDVETQELSAELRFCATSASPWWVFVHQQMARLALGTGDPGASDVDQDDLNDDGEEQNDADPTSEEQAFSGYHGMLSSSSTTKKATATVAGVKQCFNLCFGAHMRYL